MAFYIAELTKQSESKLEKYVSTSVLKEEENRENLSKWSCPRCDQTVVVGKDCSKCKKGLYEYDWKHDLLKLLVAAEKVEIQMQANTEKLSSAQQALFPAMNKSEETKNQKTSGPYVYRLSFSKPTGKKDVVCQTCEIKGRAVLKASEKC